MTNQQDAGEEEWEVKPTIVADWEFWQIWEKQGQDGGQMIADFIATEEIALGIVADHAAARRARKLEEALRRIADLPYDAALANAYDIAEAALLSPATGKEEAP